ncbi:pyrroline-5-carboxylate reductase [Salidesulfovibrio brasiliensis]
MKKIGFIGVGNMGSAIIRGLAVRDDIEIHGTDLNTEMIATLEEECGLKGQPDAKALAEACDFIVLAVKPQHAESVMGGIAPVLTGDKCLVSICAGLTVETLKGWSGKAPVIRIMPNTPAMVGEGVFAICLDDADLTEDMKAFIPDAFDGLGLVKIMAEKQFDAFTAVIGSGPAYVFYFMEALMEAGVNLGLTRQESTEMVEALFSGSAKLAKESDYHVSQLREMVSSPAGTTIRALLHMDRMATRGNIVDAVTESYERSIELGKK